MGYDRRLRIVGTSRNPPPRYCLAHAIAETGYLLKSIVLHCWPVTFHATRARITPATWTHIRLLKTDIVDLMTRLFEELQTGPLSQRLIDSSRLGIAPAERRDEW